MSYDDSKAQQLLNLHKGPKILVLPNAWDAASARVFEVAGFPAIATSSAGIAFSWGYPDGQRIDVNEMLTAVWNIVRTVSIPVTADMESAYATTPEEVAERVEQLIEIGVVGMNFEDATGDPQHPLFDMPEQVEKIRQIKSFTASIKKTFVLNARTDVFLLGIGDESERFGLALERLIAYRDAGADCLFVPGLNDPAIISKLVKELNHPINILGTVGTPSIPELEKLGVARVSIGSGPMRAAMGVVRRIAEELKNTGTYRAFTDGAIPYQELNQLMSK
ncbi:MAG TPA: isocitrate lyase/phosphoenolpyruvate mutase family protein [Blastocatellia bacterium]|nr:isocitrate lyase/phosphoenolpyruvate mutase family protein [Blastocatellia bacterium]